ncbi:Spy/CpxP family protein refolding chaperone [Methylocapsa sp. D3K7]|uniref:Spy/CpxP family protein refolding chaperone n=1 Tax=Methylocapsa sp. D3K7 TaxID=3041435 RepID=UPI00244ECBA0|nr:Spy/CpxP family protein refolding chaperone [Methylocapsa sp. D3K7]WGJ13733.1 Spy/CpxP family protein refolding chaperone [Methylocapsa sp. D3K7]
MRPILGLRAVAIAALLSTAGGFGAAIAQEQTMPGPMDPAMGGRGMMCRAAEHIDGQLAYLKTELKITPEQLPQWNVFADIFRTDKEKNARLCNSTENEQTRAMMMSASLPDSLEMTAVRLTARLESLRAMEAAIRPLYAILSPAQKKTADEIMKGAPGF